MSQNTSKEKTGQQDQRESTIQPKEQNKLEYAMRPSLENTFKARKIKDILHSVLSEVLTGKSYSSSGASLLSSQIADEASKRIKELDMSRYKHIVQVTLGQQTGAGCKYIARCQWDAECDNQVSDYYTNESLFCVIVVFGVYLY